MRIRQEIAAETEAMIGEIADWTRTKTDAKSVIQSGWMIPRKTRKKSILRRIFRSGKRG